MYHFSTDIFRFLYAFCCRSKNLSARMLDPHCGKAEKSRLAAMRRAAFFRIPSVLKRRVDELLALAPVGAEAIHETLEMRVVIALPEMRELVDDDVF